MIKAFVFGAHGLLGMALCRALHRAGTELCLPAERFCWSDENKLASQILNSVRTFSNQLDPGDRWEIYWAAGVGAMASSEDALQAETRALSTLLQSLDADPRLSAKCGEFVFSSSAGAIYAGSPAEPISEDSSVSPTTPYAREKLAQEALIRLFSESHREACALIARISTVYGPGQDAAKKQGLLAHIARSILRNQAIQIYVPYDTMRDYIAADDAADAMVSASRYTSTHPRVLTQIIASEKAATIAEIVSIFRRIARRAPHVVTSASRLSGIYSRQIQFRSKNLPDFDKLQCRSLLVGIAELMAAERQAFARGRTV